MTYGIKDDYEHRETNLFDIWEWSHGLEMQWQVYVRAYQIAEVRGFQSVLDVGTGHGGKLLHFFRDLRTVGTDVEYTVEKYLRKAHPERDWRVSDFNEPIPSMDLLICADVIEHIPNPDGLLDYISQCRPKLIILSTPDRERLQGAYQNGPPRNHCHCREWTFAELGSYVGERLNILEHFHCEPVDCTQVIVAEIK